jgi:hypothetical protein
MDNPLNLKSARAAGCLPGGKWIILFASNAPVRLKRQ